ncbi:DUF6266 family protein [Pedobacter sp. SAFR-022]|uniref:DUF6266 family protein n=1 Tax=Pedobacter sp. SAFR-022 TaxID=3436861 RepID=UPI003F816ADA
MAKAPDGILGPANGSVGNFTFYELNGQTVVRKKATFKDKPTAAQLSARGSMKTLMNFLTRIKPMLKAGYINQSRGTVRSYFNLAMSYNLRHALKLEEGSYVIDYTKVRLSEGSSPAAEEAAVSLNPTGLTFSWQADATLGWSIQHDQAMMMAYFPDEESGIYQTSGARRMAGQDVLPLPASFLNKRMEVYLGFVSDDRLAVSTSQYLGRIN